MQTIEQYSSFYDFIVNNYQVGVTALYMASSNGHIAVAGLLIAWGASVDPKGIVSTESCCLFIVI